MVAVLTPTSASTERPMALSIREEYTPPCSVPAPLRWMSSTSMLMTERPGSTSSTFAPICLEKVTSSLKYRARFSSCSLLRATPPSSLTEHSLLDFLIHSLHPRRQRTSEDGSRAVCAGWEH